MRSPLAARHLGDGDLLRLLDADAPPDELARYRAHAAACPRCATSLASLGRAAGVVRAGLAELEEVPAGVVAHDAIEAPPPRVPRDGTVVDPHGRATEASPRMLRQPVVVEPHGRPPDAAVNRVAGGLAAQARTGAWSRAWLRAAVLLLACAGALAAVQPVRARIRQWAAVAWSELVGRPAGHAAAPPVAGATAAAPRAVVWFTPAGTELRVELAARQAAGTLTLAPAAGGTAASLEVLPPNSAVVPLASERLLEIRNARASRSSYTLRLPASVRRVVLSIGSEPPRVVDATAIAAGLRVDVAR